MNIDKHFQKYTTSKSKKLGRPRTKTTIEPIQNRLNGKHDYNQILEEKVANLQKLTKELVKNQEKICDKTTNGDATLYEIGVLNGMRKVITKLNL